GSRGRRCRDRSSGAGSGSGPCASSSGRAGRTACTTGSSTRALQDPPRPTPGSGTGSSPEQLPGAEQRFRPEPASTPEPAPRPEPRSHPEGRRVDDLATGRGQLRVQGERHERLVRHVEGRSDPELRGGAEAETRVVLGVAEHDDEVLGEALTRGSTGSPPTYARVSSAWARVRSPEPQPSAPPTPAPALTSSTVTCESPSIQASRSARSASTRSASSVPSKAASNRSRIAPSSPGCSARVRHRAGASAAVSDAAPGPAEEIGSPERVIPPVCRARAMTAVPTPAGTTRAGAQRRR